MPGSSNQYADALTTLGSSLVFNEEATSVAVVKRHIPMTEMLQSKDAEQDTEDWRRPIIKVLLASAQSLNFKILKDYFLLTGVLYKRLQGGFLAKCIGIQEAEKLLKDVHASSCGLEGVVNLSRRIQRIRYYWPVI